VILDADRDGLLGAADLVLRVDLAVPGGPLTAADFAPGSFALLGGTGADDLAGTAGHDTLHGFAAGDLLAGDEGNDILLGGEGGDTLAGEAGFDTLRGGAGADSLAGGAEADVLDGGEAPDLLLGGAGADLLGGGEGADTLEAGGGADTLVGGPGADLFVLQGMGEAPWSGLAAPARVVDFDPASGDRLKISDAWAGAPGTGRGATAGLLTGPDGTARPLVFSGGPAEAVASLAAGLRLPAQPLPGLDAVQAFWVAAVEAGAPAGGWLVLDLDGDARLGAADLGPVSPWVLHCYLIQSMVAAMQSTPMKEQAVFS
jgi:Ca2+-binding RTX toxin-like protein